METRLPNTRKRQESPSCPNPFLKEIVEFEVTSKRWWKDYSHFSKKVKIEHISESIV